MKIGKKVLLIAIPALLLLSSCEGEKCDCPKFGAVPVSISQPDNSSDS